MPGYDLSKAIEMVALTDRGCVRPNNEDAVFIDAARGLAILADGMGGHRAGEVASRMAVTALAGELGHAFAQQPPGVAAAPRLERAQAVLADVIRRTNAAIRAAAASHAKFAGMGATLVVVLFYDDKFVVAHVGDSRLYRWREGFLTRLTRDHSLLQEQLDSGMIGTDQARHSPMRNLVTRALGADDDIDIEFGGSPVLPEDVYLLCSDGLNDMLEDHEIAAILAAKAGDPQACAQQLIDLANARGGRDNVSVILVRIKQGFPASRSGWH